MKFTLTEKQTVIHTYTWEVEADSKEEAIASADEGVPDDAEEKTKIIDETVDAACSHEDVYTSDRSTQVCRDCNEDIGR